MEHFENKCCKIGWKYYGKQKDREDLIFMIPYSEQEKFSQFTPSPKQDPELDYFFSHAYHDMRFFLKAITKSNRVTFTYFGDIQKNLFYISDNMKETFGFDSNLVEDLLNKWRDRIFGDPWKELYDRDRKALISEKRETHDLRYQVQDKDGKVFWIRCYGSLQWDEAREKPLFFAGRIAKQDDRFTVDPITNFPAEDTLHLRLHSLKDRGARCMTVGFSLNNISQINAVHGRNMGDRLIAMISENLVSELIGQISFYRLPGIRCMALVEETNHRSKEEIIQQIRAIIRKGYESMGFVVNNPCVFAVMQFPQPDTDPQDFTENMISLLKLAADDPKQDFVEYTEQNVEQVQAISNMQMVLTQDVLDGMQNFRAVIQPVVDCKTGRIVAGETLLRWHYNGRDVSPAVFVPVLEKDRMIHIAGRWIMEQAVKACSEIVKYIPDFYLTVNISLQQLFDEELLSFIPYVLQKYHVDGKHLVFEMTESSMDREPARLRKLIDVSHSLGVRLALDDFGTGYSSIRVLLQYNTNIIKLDRSLLLEMSQSEDKSNFICSIVYACHQFGKKVCVEGVETEQQRELVKNAECDMIQGFYFYRPTELSEVYKLAIRQHEEGC